MSNEQSRRREGGGKADRMLYQYITNRGQYAGEVEEETGISDPEKLVEILEQERTEAGSYGEAGPITRKLERLFDIHEDEINNPLSDKP